MSCWWELYGRAASRCRFLILVLTTVVLVYSDGTECLAFTFLNHRDLTHRVLDGTVGATFASEVATAVMDIDGRDNPLTDAFNKQYQPKYHCDRVPGGTHAEAFAAAQGYFQESFEECIGAVKAGNKDLALKLLGRWLHVQQDFFSHSNAWERPEFREDLLKAWDGAGKQEGKMADDWKIYITEYPEGKDRPHGGLKGGFALDSALYPSSKVEVEYHGVNQTRFETACALAVEAGRRAVTRLTKACLADPVAKPNWDKWSKK